MRNPIRRNRKIGRTQGGRVKDGRAQEKIDRVFPGGVWRSVSAEAGQVRVLRENPARDFYHPCEPEEYLELLRRLPPKLSEPLGQIVLRRVSKRDAAVGIEGRAYRACILLNSFPKDRRFWIGTRKSARSYVRHMAPWCHRVNWVEEWDEWAFIWTAEEVRRYYLYHLFLHELGHVNCNRRLPRRRNEEFAENFALEWARRLGELTETYEEAEDRLWQEVMERGAETEGTET